jgi:hypothetical protein
VKLLLDQFGVSFGDAPSCTRESAVASACVNQRDEVLELLIERGATVPRFALADAIRGGSYHCVDAVRTLVPIDMSEIELVLDSPEERRDVFALVMRTYFCNPKLALGDDGRARFIARFRDIVGFVLDITPCPRPWGRRDTPVAWAVLRLCVRLEMETEARELTEMLLRDIRSVDLVKLWATVAPILARGVTGQDFIEHARQVREDAVAAAAKKLSACLEVDCGQIDVSTVPKHEFGMMDARPGSWTSSAVVI